MSSLLKKKHLLAASKGAGMTYQQKVIADGASYYWKLDEPSGSIAVDSVGGANGTIAAGVTLNQPGAMSNSKSMLFNGSTGRITTGAVISIPVNFSFEAWIKAPSQLAGFESILSTRDGAASNGTFFGTTGANVLTILDTASHSFNGAQIVRNGIWHHIVITCNGVTAVSYIDGVVGTNASFARTISDTNLVGVIGADTPGNLPWSDSLDEVAIYPLILSPAQIAAHYAFGSARLDPTIVLLIGAETGIIDESSYTRTLTAIGNATRTTAQAKYGSASITFDGTGDGISIADSVDFTFGSGNFTVELFVRFVTRVSQDIIGHWEINGSAIVLSSWFLFHDNASTLTFRGCQGSTTIDLNGTWTPTLGQWYHIAVDRSGNTLRLYVDGVVVGINSSFTTTLNDCSSPFTLGMIGSGNPFPTSNFNGQMDEIRITKGVARYMGAFIPPTGPFPRS